MRVLLVEDELLVAMDLEMAFEERGYEVAGPAATVADALRHVRDGVDAAVLDINLGGEESLPVAEALLAQGTPFVFLTGYADRELPGALQHAPRLTKPVRPSALFDAIERVSAVTGG